MKDSAPRGPAIFSRQYGLFVDGGHACTKHSLIKFTFGPFPSGRAEPFGQRRLVENAAQSLRQGVRIVWRDSQRFLVMPRDQRNGGCELCVDDRQARGHGLDLDNPERLGFGDGGKGKDLRGIKELLDFAAGQAPGKPDSIRNAER